MFGIDELILGITLIVTGLSLIFKGRKKLKQEKMFWFPGDTIAFWLLRIFKGEGMVEKRKLELTSRRNVKVRAINAIVTGILVFIVGLLLVFGYIVTVGQ